ncbi:MAG TPA: hypothetical protein VKE69_01330 [Planctomycetota bacterium]|nr:hypothetical protein [Planctomycetota bacterium]
MKLAPASMVASAFLIAFLCACEVAPARSDPNEPSHPRSAQFTRSFGPDPGAADASDQESAFTNAPVYSANIGTVDGGGTIIVQPYPIQKWPVLVAQRNTTTLYVLNSDPNLLLVDAQSNTTPLAIGTWSLTFPANPPVGSVPVTVKLEPTGLPVTKPLNVVSDVSGLNFPLWVSIVDEHNSIVLVDLGTKIGKIPLQSP